MSARGASAVDPLWCYLFYQKRDFPAVCCSGDRDSTGPDMTGAGSGPDAEEAERCPICLGVLPRGELAMPDSCCHVFCLRCLLTWAEVTLRDAL
uniref:Uncharacterized protein n=1 Tax=Salarias fasciatus TaxID=181472 RepID=A0A672GZE7_SALFA